MAKRGTKAYITIVLCFLPAISNGLTLYQFWLETVSHDPRIALYRERLKAAAESNPLALSKLLPNLSFSAEGEWNEHHITKPEDKYSADSPILSRSRNNFISSWAVVLKQPVFNWSAIQNYHASEFQVDAAADIYQSSMQHLERKAITAYIAWQLAFANLTNLHLTKDDISRQATNAIERFKYGTSGILAADEARVALGQLIAKIESAKAAYMSAALRMKQFTGVMPAAYAPPLPIDLDLKLSRQFIWTKNAVFHNPALSAIKYQFDALRNNVSAAKGAFYPILNLIIEHQWRNENGNLSYNAPPMIGSPASSGSGIPDPHTYMGTSVMLELNFPIFSGGSQQAEVAQAQYQQESGFSKLLATKRKILANLDIAYNDVTHSQKQADVLRQSLSLAKRATIKANEGVQAGLISENNALTDQLNELSVRNGLNGAVASTVASYAQLNLAAGTLSPKLIASLSTWLTMNK